MPISVTVLSRLALTCSSNPSDMVTFLIGPNKERFLIHKETACRQSEVLRAAFNGPFIEGRTGTYILEDTRTQAFRMFMEFLYAGKLTLHYHNIDPKDDLEFSKEEHITKCATQDCYFVELWLLADRFLMSKLQNQVMDHMVRIYLSCGVMNPSQFAKIYEDSEVGSPLRRLVVTQCCWAPEKDYYEKLSKYMPKDMLVDIAIAYRDSMTSAIRNSNRAVVQATDYYVNVRSSEQ